MLCFMRQNQLFSSYWHRRISPLLLFRLHLDEVLDFLYPSQPIFVQRGLHRRLMLRHLSEHNWLGSNRYHIAGHDDHASRILGTESTHVEWRRKTEKFPNLPSGVTLKYSSTRSLDIIPTRLMPIKLTEISPLSQRKGRKPSLLPSRTLKSLPLIWLPQFWQPKRKWALATGTHSFSHQIRRSQAKYQKN